MTYCLAAKLDAGLVFVSDSRTNAGPDQVNAYGKMYTWGIPGQCQFVLLSAGNLATTQQVAARVYRDIENAAVPNLLGTAHMEDAANHIGTLMREEQLRHCGAPLNQGFNPEVTFIFGGQIAGRGPELYLIYPQRNFILPPDSAPFLQIGEIKYGKPILDRVIRADTPLEEVLLCSLVSMDSTIRSNATVGPPVDAVMYYRDSLILDRYISLAGDDPYWDALRRCWNERLLAAVRVLPPIEYERLGPAPERH